MAAWDTKVAYPGGRSRTQMSEAELILVDPIPDEVQYLEDRIYEFNSGATSINDGALLAIFVRDEGKRIVAGIKREHVGWHL